MNSANNSVVESINNTMKTAANYSMIAQAYYESAGKESE